MGVCVCARVSACVRVCGFLFVAFGEEHSISRRDASCGVGGGGGHKSSQANFIIILNPRSKIWGNSLSMWVLNAIH